MEHPSDDPVLVCTTAQNLALSLQETLGQQGYPVHAVQTHDEALAALKGRRHSGMLIEARRDAFAQVLQQATRLQPGMPVHVIDGLRVFCFYPLARQPNRLVKAILTAGVAISPYLLNFAGAQHAQGWDQSYMV